MNRSFVLLFCFFSTSVALAGGDPVFTPSDFGYAELWRRGGQHDAFAAWAAELANRIEPMIVHKEDLTKVFSVVAQARGEFAVQQDHVVKFKQTGDVNAFGKWREGDIRWGSGVSDGEGNSQESILFRAIKNQVRKRRRRRDGYTNSYRTLEGNEIPASRFALSNERNFTIFHPLDADIKAIWKDVMDRLKGLNEGPLTAEFEESFFRSLSGFFQAVPYERGSAAIGRVFFAAFYHAKTGKNLPDFKVIDVEAMIFDPTEFVERHRTGVPVTRAQKESFLMNGLCPELLKAE